MAKNKKSSNNTQKFSINNVLKHQLRKLPIGNCYINPDWKDTGVATIIITRKHINGCYSSAMYYVDLLCEGVRETHFLINKPEYEIEEILFDENELCPYTLVHNVIWGAVDFADEIGLKPHENFVKTKYFLEEDTEEIEFVDIEFGKSGRPVVIIDNEDKRHKLITTLNTTIGRENFGIIDLGNDSSNFDHLPLEYDALGFSSQEEMEDELLAYNSEEEIEEYFEVFSGIMEQDGTVDFNSLPQNYSENTILRIIETFYFLSMSDPIASESKFQEFFAQIFFDITPDSPFDIADEKISYEPVDLGYNKSKEENIAHIQLVNKVKAKKKNIEKHIKNQIEQYPDNPQFKGLLYKYLFESKGVNQIRGIEQDYDKNPEYLFFKLYYGELLIEDKNFEKVNEIFNNKTRLDDLYPEREVFHITEFVSFCHFFISFNLAIGKIETAVQYYNALLKYHVEGNDELMGYIGAMVLKAKAEYLTSYVEEINLKSKDI